MIWQLSLPGLRTLCTSTQKGEPYMIYDWDEKTPRPGYGDEVDDDDCETDSDRATQDDGETESDRLVGLDRTDLEDVEGVSQLENKLDNVQTEEDTQAIEEAMSPESIVYTESDDESIDSDSDSNEPNEPFYSDDSSEWEDRTEGGEEVLTFPKRHQPPNPLALSVCRESREVALRKYRLCFGTTNVYANLDTDIIFFSPYPREITEFGDLHKGRFRSEVVDDVEKIQRLGFKMTDG